MKKTYSTPHCRVREIVLRSMMLQQSVPIKEDEEDDYDYDKTKEELPYWKNMW